MYNRTEIGKNEELAIPSQSIKKVSAEDISYLAGIIDGEGCVNINYDRKRNAYKLRISVTNTSLILVNWLKETIGGYVYLRKKQFTHYREKYEWCIYAYKSQHLLIKILSKKVKIKKEQFSIAVRFLSLYRKRGYDIKSERELLYRKMKEANGTNFVEGVETERSAPQIEDGATVRTSQGCEEPNRNALAISLN